MPLYNKIKTQKEKSEQIKDEENTIKLMKKIREKMLVKVQYKELEGQDNEKITSEIQKLLDQFLNDEGKFLPKKDKDQLINQIVQDMLGLGPIQPLIDDDSLNEIMVNGPKNIYIEQNGKLRLTPYVFINNEHVMNVIDKIIAPVGRRIDESSPMVDARLSDGSRINAIIPPLSLNGPIVTIRKFKKDRLNIQQLIKLGSLNNEMATFLKEAVKHRLNIIIAGGTGCGKTTLLNILSEFISPDERIITIEDAAELKLNQPHVVSLETRPPNIEGKGEITIRDLVRNALRMRPDRIIVGEVRGGETLDMLQAMNTGHDGSISTIHANNPRDVLSRIETLMLMAGFDLPVKAIREQIASAIDLLIVQKRFSDGSRKITHITEVDSIENGVITIQNIFIFEEIPVYKEKTVKGRFKHEGIYPEFFRKNGNT